MGEAHSDKHRVGVPKEEKGLVRNMKGKQSRWTWGMGEGCSLIVKGRVFL